MKKKFLALLCVFAMSLSFAALAGCGGNQSAEGTTPPSNESGQPDAAGSEPAQSADGTVYTLRFSTTRGENTWFAKMYDDIIAELKESSGGRLQIEVFHNNTLGAPPDIWNMFITGSIDMLDMSPGMVGSFPVSEILNVPFLFNDDEQVNNMMQELHDAGLMKEYTDNMKVLMFLPAGGVELCTTNTKVESLSDLKGLRLRGSSAMLAAGIESLGGVATSVQPNEQTMALSQGLLDGVITGANFAEIQSLYESCHYLMNCNIGMTCMFLGINNTSYEKLPADLQQLLVDTFAKWHDEYYMPHLAEEYGNVLDRLANEHNMEIYKPSDALLADMKAATAPLLDKYTSDLDAAGIDSAAVMEIVNAAIK